MRTVERVLSRNWPMYVTFTVSKFMHIVLGVILIPGYLTRRFSFTRECER